MKKITLSILTIFIVTVVSTAFISQNKNKVNPEDSVYQLLLKWGYKPVKHELTYTPEQVDIGKQLIEVGKSKTPEGKVSKRISKHFVCTDCHNTVREDKSLFAPTPEDRLDYAVKNNIPFLQGTTLWGIVNRETWYNDDYKVKYGSLVDSARHSLKGSIQLCAKECSQGRTLDQWELDAILAYLWDNELKIKDLELNDTDLSKLDAEPNDKKIELLRSKYMLASRAHFSKPPADKMKGFDYWGDPVKGEQLFHNSCQVCHDKNGPSKVEFDDSKATKRAFWNGLNSHHSIYDIVRDGTHPYNGHKPYMPLYPKERMSDKQIEDLKAYFKTALHH